MSNIRNKLQYYTKLISYLQNGSALLSHKQTVLQDNVDQCNNTQKVHNLSFFSRYYVVRAKLCFTNKRTVQWLCALHKVLYNPLGPQRYRFASICYLLLQNSELVRSLFYLSLGTLPHRICHLHLPHLGIVPKRGPRGPQVPMFSM